VPSKFKRKLLVPFKKALVGTALIFSTGNLANSSQPPSPPVSTSGFVTIADAPDACPRLPAIPLTEGEIALVHSIFGSSVNTSIVKKYFDPDYCATAQAAAYGGKDICFFGFLYQSPDYSISEWYNAEKFGIFVHEMTHIWQAQTAARFSTQKINGSKYKYALDTKHCFSDYGMEQQAAIMEDYALCFLNPSGVSRRIKNAPENDLLLQKVVEDQFPGARKTRLAYEEQERLKDAQMHLKSPKI
jgi:hypothetical protein